MIDCKTIANAHVLLVNYVFNEGIRMYTEDGQSCIEAEPVAVTIHRPWSENDEDMIHPDSPAQRKKVLAYVDQIFNGAKGFEYTYHERLAEYKRINGSISAIIANVKACLCNDSLIADLDVVEELAMDVEEPVDQIDALIDHLKHEPMTRRAVAITWYPWKDPNTQHVPCLQFIQFKTRKVKFGRLFWLLGKKPILDMYVLFRSEDVLGAFGQNAVGFAALQRYVADCIGFEIGKYEHIVTIPHFYPNTNAPEMKRMTKC